MEAEDEKRRPSHGPLIYVPQKETVRLLEVYVKRSLSLNDGTIRKQLARKKEKWVMPRRPRRHSSDPSLHLGEGIGDENIGVFAASDPFPPERKSKKHKKKTSVWKSFVGLFSRKIGDIDEEQESSPECSMDESDPMTSCVPPKTRVQKRKSRRKRSLRRRFSKRRPSFKQSKEDASVTCSGDEPTHNLPEAVSVESTYAYYEKVSEELEKIIHEVKLKDEGPPLADNVHSSITSRSGAVELIDVSEDDLPLTKEELIKQLIEVTKKEGDAMNDKFKDNQALDNFFERMPYSSFKKLADAYIESESPRTPVPPTVLPAAPELVKLAFTLDFTARIASLSRKNVGHITGLGNRYLQDQFEYQQACTDHPWSDTDD